MTLQMLSQQAEMASLRSHSSGSSTSSLSSTFSDITWSTSTSSSSPPQPKTLAFFASPFSTRSPSPEFQVPLPSKLHSTPRSIQPHDFDSFATPRPSSPPLSAAKTSKSLLFPSRAFPSRYSSPARRSPEPHFDDTARVSSLRDTDPSFATRLENARLPTPPLVFNRDDVAPASSETIDLSTPRPPHFCPFHGLLLSNQPHEYHDETPHEETTDSLQAGSTISIPWSNVAPSALPSPAFAPTVALPNDDLTPLHGRDYGDHRSSTPKLREMSSPNGRTASLKPSSSRNSLSSLSSKIDPEARHTGSSISSQSSSELRLLKPLGHGAFSSVWLGEDLGRVPLTQISKRSVRDLRRRASGRQKARNSERSSEADPTPSPKYDDGDKEPKRSSGRLSEGLRNMLSLAKIKSGAPPSSGDVRHDHVGFLQRHPTLPSHSPPPSVSGEDHLMMLPSIPPSPFSSNSTLPPSPLSLNFRGLGDGQASTLSRDSSLRKFRDRVKGTRPAYCLGRMYLDERDGGMGEPRGGVADEFGYLTTGEESLEGRLSRRSSLGKSRDSNERLVAIKITPRRVPDSAKEEEERTRVRFVREVEVLKHISHPNITPLLAHLSSPQHHILILSYLPGGDLLTLVNSDVAWGMLTELMMRRMWCELCKAVGWMHGVGLVHRDIKLENILLTTAAFTELTAESLPPSPTSPSIPPPSSSFIKLADFGLSRFVEIDEVTGEAELLTTRCGSEAYAAPELVTAGRAGYDARKTDAWACGVVLYALIGRKLPFGEGVTVPDGRVSADLAERRHWLMKIARGEWVWPGEETDATDRGGIDDDGGDGDDDELVGLTLRKSKGSRRVVEKLLVRDPRKRARIVDLWEDVWMCGGVNEVWKEHHERHHPREERAPSLILRQPSSEGMQNVHVSPPVIIRDFAFNSSEDPAWILDDSTNGTPQGPSVDEEHFDDEDDEGGILLDHEGIDSITRQEVV